jgi:hypothetical protein
MMTASGDKYGQYGTVAATSCSAMLQAVVVAVSIPAVTGHLIRARRIG